MTRKTLRESPSQTAGPYVHIGCTPQFAGLGGDGPDLGTVMKTGPVAGQQITLTGVVFDGNDEPLRDALIEIWQADAAGLFASNNEHRGQADPNFLGWGRSPADLETGAFRFETVKPGQVPWIDGRPQAPHINVWIVARGINLGLQTRLYFADDMTANAVDPVLELIADSSRVASLMAQPDGVGMYRFDIRLQGPQETVFFDV